MSAVATTILGFVATTCALLVAGVMADDGRWGWAVVMSLVFISLMMQVCTKQIVAAIESRR